jgi:kynurenine 3-monooxygenase
VKRSINLALSARGIAGLKQVGVYDQIKASLIPMYGRYMHAKNGAMSFQPYGIGSQCIYSVSRTALNAALLDAFCALPNTSALFHQKVVRADKNGDVLVAQQQQQSGDAKGKTASSENTLLHSQCVLGCDGAYSGVRRSLARHTRMNFSQHYIAHGYKELSIPPCPETGDFAIPNEQGLHIWPRGDFMMIALPNPDKSFTCPLFAPLDGDTHSLNALKTEEQVMAYFRKEFPDIVPLMPNLAQEYFTNPSSALLTVKASPWFYKDKICLLGDSAHALVPFYGQGMNAGFEDCVVFDELCEKHGNDFAQVFPAFNAARLENCNILSDLSLHNYVEMRAHTASRLFLVRKTIERALHRMFPKWWIPLYSMVAFTRIPFKRVKARAARQDKIFKTASWLLVAGAGMKILHMLYKYKKATSRL